MNWGSWFGVLMGSLYMRDPIILGPHEVAAFFNGGYEEPYSLGSIFGPLISKPVYWC